MIIKIQKIGHATSRALRMRLGRQRPEIQATAARVLLDRIALIRQAEEIANQAKPPNVADHFLFAIKRLTASPCPPIEKNNFLPLTPLR